MDSRELAYEQSMTSAIVFNVVFCLLVIVIFPLLPWLLPQIYAPQRSLPHISQTRVWRYFWFIDIFRQPLSVFSQRGNFATIYAVFQSMQLGLYLIIALLGATLLMPVYFQGTDASHNTHYLTFWSRMTIAHLE